jgi:hypothetical protein
VAHRFSLAFYAFITVAVALMGFSIAGSGCSAQGEGDRCTFFNSGSTIDAGINGTDECQSGLVCWSGMMFPNTYGTYDRCCPPNLAQATVVQCETGGQIADASPSAGADASFDVATDTSTTDATSDAKLDAKSDAKSPLDAPSDAPSDTKSSSDATDAPSEATRDAAADSE